MAEQKDSLAHRNHPASPKQSLIAIGSNLTSTLGNPQQNMRFALREMANLDARVTAVSRFFATPAFPEGTGPDYVNAAIVIESAQSPDELLRDLHRIESRFERRRETRWGARTLDLDLIAQGQIVAPDAATQTLWRDLDPEAQQRATPETLILPHPRLQDRAFVLGPLHDIAPHWRHPLTGLSIAEMFAALPQALRETLRPLAET